MFSGMKEGGQGSPESPTSRVIAGTGKTGELTAENAECAEES